MLCARFWPLLILFLVFYILGVFLKTIIPLVLFGYEMIIANLALHASLAIYHFISNMGSWNSCKYSHTLIGPYSL